ncbi:virB11 type IV secretion protein [Phenylobacterium zucineum HLK1]|uniref:VirB11 type IV secretion protein n=1 Tax=Phenylobacterium zucineum (strain HLK1) TaxID=450851 RepID=B4RFV3_PHEZH|nr:P-type DNA transfer ATPase VirB11 [Phenylobacterium zucineum]ACG78766.1 virB11 type IV secretion protein [Phenylobacterium zucineum HLK1]
MGDVAILNHHLRPLRAALDADGTTELVVNRPGEFAVERRGAWLWHEAPELTTEWLRTLAIGAAAATAQDVSPDRPICSTVLPSGERCQIVLPPAAEHPSLTLRRPSPTAFELADLARSGLFENVATAPDDEADAAMRALQAAGDWPGFFGRAVRARRNIVVSGATGSGKTTLAKALLRLIPPDERLITVEDAREFITPHRNVVHLLYSKDGQGLAKVGPKALLESALRMRPDRILLQELRDESAFFYLRNVNSGHPGSITTVHADSASLAFEQLTLLIKESEGGRHLAREDIRGMLRMLVDVVVHVVRRGERFGVREIWYDPELKRTLAA